MLKVKNHKDPLKEKISGHMGWLRPLLVCSLKQNLCAHKKFCQKGDAIKNNLYCTLLQEVA